MISRENDTETVHQFEFEPSRVQFLEKAFSEWLGMAGRGSHDLALEEDGLAMLRWLHELIFVQGVSVEAVRSQLFEANGGLRIIAVSSGKGGVGKTTCSVNLAHAMAELGHRVLLVDADLGLGNVHVFAGVNPEVTLQDFLDHQMPIENALTAVSDRLWLLCGGSGVAGLASLDLRRMNRLMRHLRGLKTSLDYVIIDTGAGLSPQVLHFLIQAQDILVVTTPNIAATLDAYGMIKTIHEQGMNGKIHLLVNQSKDEAEAIAVSDKLLGCARQFLGCEIDGIGFLTRDEQIEQANQNRQPFVLQNTDDINTHRMNRIAATLTKTSLPEIVPSPAPEPVVPPILEQIPSTSHQPELQLV
jgi:flagellar biosynthesis protein FlhG